MKKFGLFIGIDRYHHLHGEGDARLLCAGSDAQALAKVFSSQLGFTTAVLLDEQLGWHSHGSIDAIYEQLRAWRKDLHDDEACLLLLYFAGHGSCVDGQQFLLAPRAAQKSLKKPAVGAPGIISEDALHEESMDWPNVERVFIFDACRTGLDNQASGVQIGRRVVALGGPKEEEPDVILDPKLSILRACASGQVAFELRGFGECKKNHGLYTASLLTVIEHRIAREEALVLDEAFNGAVAREMQSLAQIHLPEELHAIQPVREGAAICLIGENEMRITRLRLAFAQQLLDSQYELPLMRCCRDTLHQLTLMKADPAQLRDMTVELDKALHSQKERQRQAEGARLIAFARRLQTPEAYEKLHPYAEYEQEVEAFLQQWQVEQELALWESVVAANTAVAYQRYLRKYPQGQYVAHATKALELEESGAKHEQDTWTQAVLQAAELEEAQQIAVFKQAYSKMKTMDGKRQCEQKLELLEQAQKNLSQSQQAALTMHAENRMLKSALQTAQQRIEQLQQDIQQLAAKPFAAPAIIRERKVGSEFQDSLSGDLLGPRMVVLPAGEFQIGSNLKENEKNGPRVRIAQPFAVGKYPVMVAEYLAFCRATNRHLPQWLEVGSQYHYQQGSESHYRQFGDALTGERFPIVGVSWHNAQAYITWLNANKQDKSGAYALLSEAQWEYAARAGSAGKWCFGDDETQLTRYAWYSENAQGVTHAVGELAENQFGLADMHGNVGEWVEDNYHDTYQGAPKDGSAWVDDDQQAGIRVLRGGSWFNYAAFSRSANRNFNRPLFRINDVGFRVARTLP